MVDDRGNYFAPCGWMKKEMSPFELVDGCKACAQRYHYRVKVPVTAGPRPTPPDPHGPVANAVALGAVAALAPPGSGVVARNTVGDRAVGQGAPSSGPRGDELGRAPPEVRVRWVGPPSAGLHPAVTPLLCGHMGLDCFRSFLVLRLVISVNRPSGGLIQALLMLLAT